MEHNRAVALQLAEARERARPAVERALADAALPAVEHMADYLLAAREVLQSGTQTKESTDRIAQIRKLDAALLVRWTAAVRDAAKDASDPLHAWAAVCAGGRADDPKPAATATKGVEVVVDYARGRPEDWMPDGVAFGPRASRSGDVRIDGEPGRPNVRLCTIAAAEYDRTWDCLKLAPGAENEVGALGRMVRSGRTIRTPSFVVNPGKIFYLVKGGGMVYAAVDSHVMIAGPLHGQLVGDIPASDTLHWAAIDLTPYKGRRAHLEFTAAAGSAFAVARVVQADAAPGPVDSSNHALLILLSGRDARSPEGLAAAYQRVFLDAAKRLGADRIAGAPDAADYARLANWLLKHTDLLPDANAAALQETADAALAEQRQLAGQIRRESRLALAMQDGDGVNEHVFKRGSYKTLGDVAPRHLLEALTGPARRMEGRRRGSGRLELARQMTDPALDPFVPRVMVNRIWHHLFGRGIVASVDNFGVMGEAPTHPELLDYLADRFVKDGWSVKKTIRTLVLSSAYRMSSHPTEADKDDPQNLLLHRARLRRLEGEAIRDAMLSVSGRLDLKMYGPSVPVHLTPFLEGRGRPADGPLDGAGRRSIYTAVRRNFLSPMMLAFDTPSPFSTVGRRTVSNVPAQALILMNDPFVHQQAEVWAKRVLGQGGSDKERITRMYLAAFSRPPTDAESSDCLDFLVQQAKLADKKPDDPAVWADLAHTLFNVKEFIFLN